MQTRGTDITNAHPIWPHVEALNTRFRALSDRVWATPETCYGEHASVAAHAEELEAQGFRVTKGVADIPTAIVGEWGDDGPVIAFLGEFDALAGLSQVADLAEKVPLKAGANGHGCGHNMLGAGAMQAAVALRDWCKASGTKGRIRYYGCPAEEGGAGKGFMVRAGLFDDADIAITWHPGSIPHVERGSSLANCRVDFTFAGRASHAAASPDLGRSALDAAELMNIGANYLREHMPDRARLHYAYIDAGGISPNVVQDRAQLRYVVRDITARRMRTLLARVVKVAEGAALMTETQMTWRVLAAASELLPNTPLCDAMQRNLDLVGPAPFTQADRDYAAQFQETLQAGDIVAAYEALDLPPDPARVLPDVLHQGVTADLPASTDVGDVSWVVPTVQMFGGNYAIGTPFHSWQMVAQGKGEPALKGMTQAALVMAMTGYDALRDPALREAAWADLRRRQGPEGYVSPLPDGAKPPVAEMAG